MTVMFMDFQYPVEDVAYLVDISFMDLVKTKNDLDRNFDSHGYAIINQVACHGSVMV
jgi:hypothetical protein